MAKDAYYFSHDSNAKTDPAMLACRAKYGSAGYGDYFMIVEMLRDENGYKIPLKKHVYASIGLTIGKSASDAKHFVDDLVEEFDLLSRDKKFLWSESLLRRMGALEMLRAKRAEAGRKGGIRRQANLKQSSSKPQAVDLPSRFKRPSIEEISAYAKERKSRIKPERFLDINDANGWVRGKNQTPIRDWKAVFRTWEARESDEDAAQRKKEATAGKRRPTPCSACSVKPPEPLSAFCKGCAWCTECDSEGKDRVPATQLKKHPKTGRALCPKHLKALKVTA